MVVPQLKEPTLVYQAKAFGQMLNQLSKQPLIALDTESDSLYRYQPRVCLIQISTLASPDVDPEQADESEVVDYLVDPLRLEDISPLGMLLADPAIEVVMHAAENDILELSRDFGFLFQYVFDTQLAARILGWQRVGLAAILEEKFGVISDKRMQRTDWGKRPLTPQQITYAQMDTHFLPTLRTLLIQQLQATGRWEEAQEAFAMLSRISQHARTGNGRSVWSMKIAREVPRVATGVLEALWQWREQMAQRQNWPPFKIMNDQALAALATHQPKELNDIQRISGLNAQQMARYGIALRDAINAGLQRPLPALPEARPRPEQLLDNAAFARYEALRRWRSKVADERGVTLDIIFNNNTLLDLAQRAPRTEAELLQLPEIGPWKARTYGPELLAILQKKKSTV